MIRQPISRWSRVMLGVLAFASLLGGYTALSYSVHLRRPEDRTIPTWRQLGDGVRKIFSAHPDRKDAGMWLWFDARATGWRLFLGLSISVVLALVLGLLMGCFKKVEAAFLPPLALLAKVPPTAMLPVFFVLFGTELVFFLLMIIFGIVPTMAQTVYLAAREVSDEYLYKAYTLGASNAEAIWNVIVRTILPKLLDALRLAIGPAVVYLVAAEMLAADSGFGHMFRMQIRILNLDVVYPYVALLAAFCFTVDAGLRLLQRKLCPWYVPEEGR